MIVFQVKGKSHRLSTLKGKEKDVIKRYAQGQETTNYFFDKIFGIMWNPLQSKKH